MNHKHHCECKHENMAYCKKCDTAYCEDCGKEWKNQTQYYPYYPYWHIPTTWTEPIITWGTSTTDSTMLSEGYKVVY